MAKQFFVPEVGTIPWGKTIKFSCSESSHWPESRCQKSVPVQLATGQIARMHTSRCAYGLGKEQKCKWQWEPGLQFMKISLNLHMYVCIYIYKNKMCVFYTSNTYFYLPI